MLIFSRYLDEMKHLYTSTEKQLIEFNELIPFYKNNLRIFQNFGKFFNIIYSNCNIIPPYENKIKRLCINAPFHKYLKDFQKT